MTIVGVNCFEFPENVWFKQPPDQWQKGRLPLLSDVTGKYVFSFKRRIQSRECLGNSILDEMPLAVSNSMCMDGYHW